jgi:hypothetical protein
MKKTSQKGKGHFSLMNITHLPLLLELAGEVE